MKTNLHRHLEGIYRILRNRFEFINNSIEHSLTQGEENEEEIRKLLIEFLPSNYGISSGIIIDTKGNSSKQIDIIIYDKSLPNYTLSADSKLFLLDQVIAIIEIKTTFTTGDKSSLNSALENIKSVNELIPSPKTWVDLKSIVEDEKYQSMLLDILTPAPPISIIFFYSTPKTKKPLNIDEFYKNVDLALNKIPQSSHPDILFSLGHASFLKYTDFMVRKKPITKNTFLLQLDDGSNRNLDAGLTENHQALINYGDVEFQNDTHPLMASISDSTGKYQALGVLGDEINLDPIYYKTCKFDEKIMLLNPFRAFINFLTLIEFSFRIKKTNKNGFITDYFPSDYFFSSSPKTK